MDRISLGQWACMGGAGHRLALLNVLQLGPSVGHGHGHGFGLGVVGLHGPKAVHQSGKALQPGNRCQHDGKAHSLGRSQAPGTAGTQWAAGPSVGVHQLGAVGLHGPKAGHQLGKVLQLGNRRQHQALQARSGLPGPSVGHMGTGSHQPGAAGLHGRRRPQAGAAERVAARPIGGAHGHRIASAWGSRPAWAKADKL